MLRTPLSLWQTTCFLRITEIASGCDCPGAPRRPAWLSGSSVRNHAPSPATGRAVFRIRRSKQAYPRGRARRGQPQLRRFSLDNDQHAAHPQRRRLISADFDRGGNRGTTKGWHGTANISNPRPTFTGDKILVHFELEAVRQQALEHDRNRPLGIVEETTIWNVHTVNFAYQTATRARTALVQSAISNYLYLYLLGKIYITVPTAKYSYPRTMWKMAATFVHRAENNLLLRKKHGGSA